MMPDISKIINKDTGLKIIFGISGIYLTLQAALRGLDYQDTWTMQNLQASYILFLVILFAVFLLEDNFENLLLYSIAARVILFLLPNLKYEFFLGVSLDQHIQYTLTENIIKTQSIGIPSDVLVSARYYTDSPLFHTAIASFGILTGLDVVQAFKFFPLSLNLLFPLYFYIILRKMSVKNLSYLKYSLFLATLGGSYIVTGTMFIFPFLLGFLNQVISLIQKPERSRYIVLLVLIVGATMAHPIETLNFILILLAVSVMVNLVEGFRREYLIRYIAVGLVLDLGWIWLRESQFRYFAILFLERGGGGGGITPTFFLLLRASVVDTIKILVRTYGDDFFLTIFVVLSLYYLLREYLQKGNVDGEYKFLVGFLMVVGTLTLGGYILGIGMGYFARSFRNYTFVIILFSGYFLNYLKGIKLKTICSLLMGAVLLLFFTRAYSPPWMNPSASLLFPVEEEVPLISSGQVNSIYQRELIQHAYNHNSLGIASDAVTRNQMIGLTDGRYFDNHVLWYNPLLRRLNPNINPKPYGVFMIHMPGISGSFEERADLRDSKTIMELLNDGEHDLVYSNSQSFMLHK